MDISTQPPRKTKVHRWALALLVFFATLLVVCWWVEVRYPQWLWVPYVRAFSEAACIGAMADWFAVVALFKHPMGIPLPHTAILPAKHAQLSEGVAKFIGTHFLDPEVIGQHAKQMAVGEKIADYVQQNLQEQTIERLMPSVLKAIVEKIPEEANHDWVLKVQHVLVEYADAQRVGKGGATLLQWFENEGGLTKVTNRIANILGEFCAHPDSPEKIRPWLHEFIEKAKQQKTEASWWEKIKSDFSGQALEWADDWVIEKALAAGRTIAAQVQIDPDHAIHMWVRNQSEQLNHRLRDDADYQLWLSAQIHKAIGSAFSRDWLFKLWRLGHGKLQEISREQNEHSNLIAHMIYQAIMGQAEQPERRAWLTQSAASWSSSILSSQQSNIQAWITAQMNAWSKERLNNALQNAIGNDLQFIRINGTLIGGLIGLLIFVIGKLLHQLFSGGI